jgi:hypothetical protein
MEETTDLFQIFYNEKVEQYEFLKNKRILLNAKVTFINTRKAILSYSIYLD